MKVDGYISPWRLAGVEEELTENPGGTQVKAKQPSKIRVPENNSKRLEDKIRETGIQQLVILMQKTIHGRRAMAGRGLGSGFPKTAC